MNDMMTLIEPLIPPLRRYARALVQDSGTADDLVQDCLELAIRRWHQRRADGDTRSWIFAILHNLAVSRFRQTKRRGPHVPIEDASPDTVAQAPQQEQGLLERDVMRALGSLPEDQKSVLLLVSVEEMSYAEVARALNIPVGTVMSRLSRARERMRRLIDADETPNQILPFRPRSAK